MDVAGLCIMLYADREWGEGGGKHCRKRKCNDRETQKSMACSWDYRGSL